MRVSDDEIACWLESQETPPYLSDCARALRVHRRRVRRIAEENSIELKGRYACDDVVSFEDAIAHEARRAMESGDGLDNALGALVAMVCRVSPEAILHMASGGTVTICGDGVEL